MPTFEDGINRKRVVEIPVQPGQVPSALTDYELTITEAMFGGDALEIFDSGDPNSAQNGGGDIRVATDKEGVNQIAIDVVTFLTDADPANGECEINGLVPSFPTDAKVYVFYNTSATASQPAASHAYGSDNAYRASNKLTLGLHENPAGTAPQFIDRTANGNDGTANGGMTAGDSVDGQVGDALDFDGVDDYVGAGTLDISGWTAVSWSCWMRTPNPVNARIFSLRHSGSDDIRIWSSSVGSHVAVDDGTAYVAALPEIRDGNWHYITGTFDGSTVRAYHNGDLHDSTGAASFNFATADGLTAIGRNANGGLEYQGQIDDVRIHAEALTADFITARHNNTRSPGAFAAAGTPEGTSAPVTAPTSPGIEARLSRERPHGRLKADRPHARLSRARLHGRVKET